MKKMKLLFFLLLIGLPSAFLAAQIVELTESFEDHSATCLEFKDGCIPGWFNTHGTASVEESATFGNLSPVTGNYLAHMYVTKNNNCLNSGNSADRGEGMALNFNFVAGEAYQISYHLAGKVGEVTWYMSNDLVSDSGVPTQTCVIPGTAVPVVPAGSQAITPSQILFDNTDEWVSLETDWFSPNVDYSQLWFRASNLNQPNAILTSFVHLDQVIIRRKGECVNSCPPAFTDLTACPEEGQFGFISFDCEATYLWDIPAGSTAIEATSSTHSSLVQVSSGTYLVTVTDVKGCEAYHQFIVKEDCCKMEEPCLPPQKLACDYNAGGVMLEWEDVPGAQGYIIEVIYNDDDCGCGTGGSTYTVSELVIDPSYLVTNLYLELYNKCFSWRVTTVCDEQSVSEDSEVICFDGSQDCFPLVKEACLPPQKLACDYNAGGVVLEWGTVPGAQGYIIEVIYNDDDCGCGTGGPTYTVSELVLDPNYLVNNLYLELYNKCFSWRVRTVCDEQSVSADSEVICFDGSQDCFPLNGLKPGGATKRGAEKTAATAIQANVYPNPITDDFNFTLALPVSTALSIRVFDVNGKSIYELEEGFVPAGFYQKNWSPGVDLADGVYFVQFHTDTSSVSEMVFVKRGN